MELARLIHFLRKQNLWNTERPATAIHLAAGQHRWMEPGTLVALTAALLTHSRVHGAPITVDFSKATNTTFMDRVGFVRLLGVPSPKSCPGHRDPSGRFIELTPFRTLQEVERLTREAASLLDADGLVGPYIQRCLEEAMRNAVQHAGDTAVRLVAAQRFPQQRRVQLAVADAGVGILQSLQRNAALRPTSSREALEMAVQPGVSGAATLPTMSDFERNRGFGRFLLTESAAQTLGQLVLAAGDALFVQDGNHRRIFPIHPWQGTFLALELLEDHLDAFYELQVALIQRLPNDQPSPRVPFEQASA